MAENREMSRRRISPHRPFCEIMPDGAWAGERCFIVGGGPSLIGFDFGRLRGQGRIIAVNKSFIDVPFADIIYFMDGSKTTFYGQLHSGKFGPEAMRIWTEFKGHKVYLNIMGRKLDDVYSIRSLGSAGLSTSLKMGLYSGNNSGTGAMGLALCLGANPIYLLGIDCKFKEGKNHYHSGYGNKTSEKSFKSFTKNFESFGKFVNKTQIRVINLNPDSAVRCFPFSTIGEVLGDGKTR